jgi:riboflavin synthase alpha subunit
MMVTFHVRAGGKVRVRVKVMCASRLAGRLVQGHVFGSGSGESLGLSVRIRVRVRFRVFGQYHY